MPKHRPRRQSAISSAANVVRLRPKRRWPVPPPPPAEQPKEQPPPVLSEMEACVAAVDFANAHYLGLLLSDLRLQRCSWNQCLRELHLEAGVVPARLRA